MSTPTGHATDAHRPPVRRVLGLVAAATVVMGAGVLGLAGLAGAAAVAPVAFPGPTGCGQLAARFGGGPVTEIRFSTLPSVGATKTATRAGVTVTVRRLSPSTMAWQASADIRLVFVNAGRAPHESSAVYRYEPPSRGDTGLQGTNPSDVLDHVVVCFGQRPTTTTGATTTTLPEEVTTTTLMVPIVSCAFPPTCQIANTTTTTTNDEPQATTVPTPSSVAPSTTLVGRLPETGGAHDRLAMVGAALVAAGLLTLVLTAQLRQPGTADVAADRNQGRGRG